MRAVRRYTLILTQDYHSSRVGGTCIEDVVKCLAHNKPLTCAAEASDYIDIYSKNQQEYELRAVSDRLNMLMLLTSRHSEIGSM